MTKDYRLELLQVRESLRIALAKAEHHKARHKALVVWLKENAPGLWMKALVELMLEKDSPA